VVLADPVGSQPVATSAARWWPGCLTHGIAIAPSPGCRSGRR